MDLKLSRPGFWMSVVLVLVVLCAQTALSVPLSILDHTLSRLLLRSQIGLVQNPMMVGLINIIAFAAAIAIGLNLNRQSFLSAFSIGKLTAPQITAIIVLTLGGDLLLSELDNVFRWLVPPPRWVLQTFQDLFGSGGGILPKVFLLMIVAPLTEELLCRGIILRGLLSHYRPAAAVALSALLFAGAHVNPWQFASAFWLGVACGWFYLRTGSLGACILTHAFSNGMCVLFSSLPLEIPGLTGPPEFTKVEFQPWWLDLGGAVLLLVGLMAFHKAAPVRQTLEQPKPPVIPPPLPDQPLPV